MADIVKSDEKREDEVKHVEEGLKAHHDSIAGLNDSNVRDIPFRRRCGTQG